MTKFRRFHDMHVIKNVNFVRQIILWPTFKIQEYQLLEDKLRSVLEALMERERQLSAKETSLNAIQRDLEREIELRERDLMDGVQRKVRETEQALGAERQRNLQLTNEVRDYFAA